MKAWSAWALALALTLGTACCMAFVETASTLVIEDLRCKGNVSTSCRFILSHLYLTAGERVSETEIQNAKLRLAASPLFIFTDIHLERGSEPGKAIVVVEVVEADRVENESLVGSSSRLSSRSQTLESRITAHNVLGTGNTINLDLQGVIPISGLTRRAIFSRLQFVDPKAFGSARGFTIAGLSYEDGLTNYPNGDSLKIHQLGLDASYGRRIFRYSYVTVGYLYRAISDSSDYHRGRSGVFWTDTDPTPHGLSLSYGWDSEDDPYFPTQGSRFTTSAGESWASLRYRKTWSCGANSALTLTIGGTPGTQFRSSLDETQQVSLRYAHRILTGGGEVRQGQWYVEPGISNYGQSVRGRTLEELGIKAGVRLDTQSLGVIELYVFGSTSSELTSKDGR